MTSTVHFSSLTGEWLTPRPVLDLAIRVLGEIDLDPAADEGHNVPAQQHYTKADDGMQYPWYGRVWMNPPYGNPVHPCRPNCRKAACARRGHHITEYVPGIQDWVRKLVADYRRGYVAEAIALLPARTDNRWWQLLRDYPVCFVRGRLRFVGSRKNSAPFPSMLVYLGPDVGRFVEVFGAIGDVWERRR